MVTTGIVLMHVKILPTNIITTCRDLQLEEFVQRVTHWECILSTEDYQFMVVTQVEKKNSLTFHRPPKGFPHFSYQVESSKFVLKVVVI